MTSNSSIAPRPVVKWAGGKRQLLEQMEKFIPKNYNTYIEPFVGGGALFFHLKPKKAILIDFNKDLMNVYRVIKQNVDELIDSLNKHKNEKKYYYKMRNADREPGFGEWSDVEKASRMLYMNKVCFNGLYRVNRKGQFNVPFGKYKNPTICDEDNFHAVHKILQNVILVQDSFEKCKDYAKEGDFVYFDPPYVPLSETASFTSYTRLKFDKSAQMKLHEVFVELDNRGCKLMLSNSHHKFILDLYKDFKIETLMATRAINCDAKKRGKIKEVLILNQY